MATMLIKHTHFLSLLLLLVPFAFPKSNAIPVKDVYSLCKESTVVDYCLKHIGSDKRIVAARDFYDVFLIAVSEIQSEVTAGLEYTRHKVVRQIFNYPVGKRQIALCEKKYKMAVNSFQKAREVGQKKSKSLKLAMSQHTDAGFEAVRECEDEWSKDAWNARVSPVQYYYHNIQNLRKITRVIISKL